MESPDATFRSTSVLKATPSFLFRHLQPVRFTAECDRDDSALFNMRYAAPDGATGIARAWSPVGLSLVSPRERQLLPFGDGSGAVFCQRLLAKLRDAEVVSTGVAGHV